MESEGISVPTSTLPMQTGPQLFEFNDYTQRIIIAVVVGVVFLLGTSGNGLVILAVLLSKKLQSSTNWFVVNLACADLFTCLCLPFNIVALLSRDGWPLPDWICAAASAVTLTCLGASVMTLALIAYNRWYLLTQPPAKFQKLYTKGKIMVMVIAAWMYPFLLVIVPHFAGLGKLGYSNEYKTCTQDTSLPTSEFYSLLAGVMAIIPVFLAVVIIYVRIYRFVTKQMKHMSTLRETGPASSGTRSAIAVEMNSSEVTSDAASTTTTKAPSSKSLATLNSDLDSSQLSLPPPLGETLSEADVEPKPDDTNAPDQSSRRSTEGNSNPSNSAAADPTPPPKQDKRSSVGNPKASTSKPAASKLERHHVRVTKRLAVVVVAFFICLLPFGVSVAVPPSDPGIPWTGLLVSLNSCINPMIYARTMPDFRKVMGCIVRCSCTSIPQPVSCIRRH
ncbi:uncharacterized protein [Diadema setosum]|uniref:uncharacterized protein n=1 Tax=Diadema setosum TaxID=31175 RepID=UPI003B3AD722